MAAFARPSTPAAWGQAQARVGAFFGAVGCPLRTGVGELLLGEASTSATQNNLLVQLRRAAVVLAGAAADRFDVAKVGAL